MLSLFEPVLTCRFVNAFTVSAIELQATQPCVFWFEVEYDLSNLVLNWLKCKDLVASQLSLIMLKLEVDLTVHGVIEYTFEFVFKRFF